MSKVQIVLNCVLGCIAWTVIFYMEYLPRPSVQTDIVAQLTIHLGGCGFIAAILAGLNLLLSLGIKSKRNWEYLWQLDLAVIGVMLVILNISVELRYVGVILVPLARIITWFPIFVWRTIRSFLRPPKYISLFGGE